MHPLPHLATRIYDPPLLIAPQKLEVILAALAPRLGIEVPPVSAAAATERASRKPYEVTPEGIAIIPVEGTLVHKTRGLDALSGLRSYVDVQKEIEDAATDPTIIGILLEIDSPGGEVAGAFDVADTVYSNRPSSQRRIPPPHPSGSTARLQPRRQLRPRTHRQRLTHPRRRVRRWLPLFRANAHQQRWRRVRSAQGENTRRDDARLYLALLESIITDVTAHVEPVGMGHATAAFTEASSAASLRARLTAAQIGDA